MNPDLLAALIRAGLVSQADADLLTRALADPASDQEAARLWAENLLTNAAQTGLSAQQERLIDLLRQTEADPTAAELAQFWQGEDAPLLAALRPALVEVASERALAAAKQKYEEGLEAFKLLFNELNPPNSLEEPNENGDNSA